ncbi:Gfo/Idh/MocA family protein [Phytohabitans kaempferiae]|uniref:Gfo/Idh/MocA family protein n=1 Tax=Phytohabitans kaempferiae TaxID=1620943 RepID=A0ABV6MD55_9ACTN
MRIALAGLATSHPYTDASTLREHCELAVWEPDPARLQRFRDEHPQVDVLPDLTSLLATRPDGVMLTVPTPQVPAALRHVLDLRVPCFVNKPAAATADQLAELDDVVAAAPELVFSSSVLRFAPAFTRLRADLDAAEPPLAARVTVRHDARFWAAGNNPWQDDPEAGGGMLVLLGVHGVELLVALFGPDVRLVGAVTARRHYRSLRSEDTALLTLAWEGGPVGIVEVLASGSGEAYEVAVHGPATTATVTLEGGDDPRHALGYRGAVEAFLAMVAGQPSPVPWPQTQAILKVLTAARATA